MFDNNPYSFNPFSQYPSSNNLQMQPMNMYQAPQLQVKTVMVGSVEEAKSIQTSPNVLYVAVDRAQNKVYLKQFNNNGLVDFEVYSKTEQPQEEPKQSLDEKIDALNERLACLGDLTKRLEILEGRKENVKPAVQHVRKTNDEQAV